MDPSKVLNIGGLVFDGFLFWNAHRLWTKGSKGWGGLFVAWGLGGVAWNVYGLVKPAQPLLAVAQYAAPPVMLRF
jgi:hypothetical protein